MNVPRILAIIFLLVILLTGAYIFTENKKTMEDYKDTEVHVHSDFLLVIEGEEIDFTADTYQSDTIDNLRHENFHFHENEDHVIHRHAEALTLAVFLDSLGYTLTTACLETDTGAKYCNNERETVRLYVNGTEHSSIGTYIPEEEDQILLIYGDRDEAITQYLNKITDESCIYSGTCPERGVAPPESCGLTCEL